MLRDHGRYPYSPIIDRPGYDWPGGRRLAVYVGYNLEHFAFGEGLGAKLGCVFYQVPKFVKKDLAVLRDFLALQRPGLRAAFEFAHASWAVPDVHALLHAHGATVVASDKDGELQPELSPSAPWTYLRLRRAAYDDAELRAWRERITAAGGSDAFVFFKHEDSCAGPALAARFLGL